MKTEELYSIYKKNRLISTDTRNIIPGSIFFALKGESFNGNLFAMEAIEKGAIAAVVDESLPWSDNRIIRVEDVLKSLQMLASCHRKHAQFTILAITGSNGKTTTKELCAAVLSVKFKIHATQGNLNNHIGVPITLLSMSPDMEVGVIEMGANHPGEIKTLCEIALPDYGLITNIGKAHLEGFGGIEGVARAKGEMFEHLIRKEKTVFLNEGNPYLPPLVKDYGKVIPYNSENGLKVLNLSSNPLLNIQAAKGDLKLNLMTNLTGSYNVENVLAACCVGLQFGITPSEIEKAMGDYQPKNNRSQLIRTSKNTVFMDAYNANPSSMTAAVNEFIKLDGSKKLLIIGEMREVGDASVTEHEEILRMISAKGMNEVICVGKAFENSARKYGYTYTFSVEELTGLLDKKQPTGYLIFVKGSRSNRLEKILPLL